VLNLIKNFKTFAICDAQRQEAKVGVLFSETIGEVSEQPHLCWVVGRS